MHKYQDVKRELNRIYIEWSNNNFGTRSTQNLPNFHRFWELPNGIKMIHFKKVRFKNAKKRVTEVTQLCHTIPFLLFLNYLLGWQLRNIPQKTPENHKKNNRHGVTFKLYLKSKVSNCFVVNQIFVQWTKILTTLLKEKRKKYCERKSFSHSNITKV